MFTAQPQATWVSQQHPACKSKGNLCTPRLPTPSFHPPHVLFTTVFLFYPSWPPHDTVLVSLKLSFQLQPKRSYQSTDDVFFICFFFLFVCLFQGVFVTVFAIQRVKFTIRINSKSSVRSARSTWLSPCWPSSCSLLSLGPQQHLSPSIRIQTTPFRVADSLLPFLPGRVQVGCFCCKTFKECSLVIAHSQPC